MKNLGFQSIAALLAVCGMLTCISGSAQAPTPDYRGGLLEPLEPNAYGALAGFALEFLRRGDRERAWQDTLIIEHFWGTSDTAKRIGQRWPDRWLKIHTDMDKFISAIRNSAVENRKAGDLKEAELAYQQYVADLNGVAWLSQVLWRTIHAEGIAAAVEQYRKLQVQGFPDVLVTEDELDGIGGELLEGGHKAEAIKIFQLNVEAYPNSATVYDSLGDGYASVGNKALAIENYRLALSIDPKVGSAVKIERLQQADYKN